MTIPSSISANSTSLSSLARTVHCTAQPATTILFHHTHTKTASLNMHNFFLLFLLLFLFFTDPVSPLSHPDHFTTFLRRRHPQPFFEVTQHLPSGKPTRPCSRHIIRHSFADTVDSPPFSAPYYPPSDCLPPWSIVILDFYASCKGLQYDRMAGLWLGGVELLRTSTAEPTRSGVSWNFRKDVTKYSSLLVRDDLDFTMMLENVVDKVYTGVYDVKITFLYFKSYAVRVPFRTSGEGLNRRAGLLGYEFGGGNRISQVTAKCTGRGDGTLDFNESPADLIIPISNDNCGGGFWFRIENETDLVSKKIRIPRNTHRAVLELYVSSHGNDEFWYSNPPNSYITTNHLTNGRGNGAYREVYVMIDGEIVGSEVPFPVIYAGGVNPLLWEPVAAIGAFNLPSYDLDLTPFLGMLLDKQEHSFEIGVRQGLSYWLVNANLHLWLDHHTSVVKANPISRERPQFSIERSEDFMGLDGNFEIEAEGDKETAGWVNSSAGNITTFISHKFKFKNHIKLHGNGTYKMVKHRIKWKKKIKIKSDKGELIANLKIDRKFPLLVITSTLLCYSKKDRFVVVTNVSQALKESYSGRGFSTWVLNTQDSNGWMKVVRGNSVQSGQASTRQNYVFKDKFNCYTRHVLADNGKTVSDNTSNTCVIS